MSKLSKAITGAPVPRDEIVKAIRNAADLVDEALPVDDPIYAPLRSVAFDRVLQELLTYEVE